MGKTVTIPKCKCYDPFYRYKRPVISKKLEKNFIKIVNIDEISSSLERCDNELCQWFKKRIGTNVRVEGGSLIINSKKGGVVELEDILEEFIEGYVICRECGNPETWYSPYKTRVLLICKACGGVSKLEKGDHLDWIVKKLDLV